MYHALVDNSIIFLFHILCYDIWYYIIHQILHSRHFYFIHKKHHKQLYTNRTYLDTYSGEMLEFPLQTLGVSFPLLLEKENEKKISLFIYALIFITVRNVMEHDRRFAWLVGNHHLLHHQYPNHNFGEAWIDYTFGTNYYKNT